MASKRHSEKLSLLDLGELVESGGVLLRESSARAGCRFHMACMEGAQLLKGTSSRQNRTLTSHFSSLRAWRWLNITSGSKWVPPAARLYAQSYTVEHLGLMQALCIRVGTKHMKCNEFR
jgi:hypothetical protein